MLTILVKLIIAFDKVVCIDGSIAKFNTVQIVTLITFRDLADKCRKVRLD